MTTTFQATTSRDLLRVAEFNTSIDFVPYIREQTITFYATGLRPGARVYAFFDGVYVTDRIIPATIANTANVVPTRASANANIIPNGQTLAEIQAANTFLTVSNDGVVAGVFHLPNTTFFTGDREFVIADVSNYNSLDTASTYSKKVFYAYNFNPQVTPTPTAEPPPVVNPITLPINIEPIFFWDPVAQTFVIPKQDVNQLEGVYVSSVDLFFATKDAQRGVTVQITETLNGYPARTVLPGSVCWKHPDYVNTSTTGVTATTFTFPQLVYLKTDTEYAVVVIPDGNNPNYQIYTAAGGGNDLATGTTVRQDWGFGVLFRSTNNRTWTAIQNEDLKLTLKIAEFSSTSGHIVAQNKDYEFLTVNAISSNFLQGELVWQVTRDNSGNTFLAGNISANTTNTTVTGTGTSFSSNFAVGQYLPIPNHNNYSSATKFDLVKIVSIPSSTSMILERRPTVNVAAGQVQNPVVGFCDFFDRGNQQLTLIDSTAANSNFLLRANSTIIGLSSNATAVIQSIDNKIVNYHQALINKMSPPSTSLTVQQAYTVNVGGTYTLQSFEQSKLNDSNFLPNYEAVVASRSTEITSNLNGAKSFRANIQFATTNTLTSPILNTLQLSSLTYRNLISNTNTNEHGANGNANTKHISTKVVLADGQDAEDIKVYLTAYKPANTEIEVYVKAISAFDSELFDTKAWTKLIQTSDSGSLSSTLNTNDFREFEYSFPEKPQSTVLTGVASCNTTSANVNGVGTAFNTELTTSDAVILVNPNDPTVFDIKRVTTVTNSTHIVLSSNCEFTSSGAKIEKMVVPTSIFKNIYNDKIIRYFGVSGGTFDTFKTFAVKIVLLADSSNRVPAVNDIRAIALSV